MGTQEVRALLDGLLVYSVAPRRNSGMRNSRHRTVRVSDCLPSTPAEMYSWATSQRMTASDQEHARPGVSRSLSARSSATSELLARPRLLDAIPAARPSEQDT